MNREEKNNSFENAETGRIRPVKRSFKEARNEVEDRIEWQCFRPDRRAEARELAMIIAEVELMAPDKPVRIEGEDKPAGDVAEIYQELTHDHIEYVLDNLAETRYRVKAMKTYIRTALYNSVFTLNNGIDNMAKSDL